MSVPLDGDVRSFDLTVFKEAIMATFAVIHQRYADEFTLTTIVEAVNEYLASSKVWPEFNDSEWAWLTTEPVVAEEWDIPF